MNVLSRVKYIRHEKDEYDKEHIGVWYPPYGTLGTVKKIDNVKEICEVQWDSGIKDTKQAYWCWINDCEVLEESL